MKAESPDSEAPFCFECICPTWMTLTFDFYHLKRDGGQEPILGLVVRLGNRFPLN